MLEHVVAAPGGGLELAKAFGVSAPEAIADGRFRSPGVGEEVESSPVVPEVAGDDGGRLGAKASLEVASGSFKKVFKDGLQGEDRGACVYARTPSKGLA